MRILACIVVAAVLVGACSSGDGKWSGTVTDSAGVAMVQNPLDGDWTVQAEPEIVEELSIGAEEGDPAYQFGRVVALDVDESGRIHVLDQQAAQVRIFDSEGRHLRSVGKPGGGPGELSPGAAAVLAGPNDVVYVADMMRQRIAGFGADGTEVGSSAVNIQTVGIPVRFDVSPHKRFIMQTRAMTFPGALDTVPMKDRILLRDPASEQADTLLELESGNTIKFGAGGIPQFRIFESEPVWAVLQNGRIAHGRNDAFRVEVLAADGSLERVITRPVERRPVTEADRTALLDLMRQQFTQQMGGGTPPPQAVAMIQQMLESTQFADNYPVYAALLGGPGGTLWAQRIRTADDVKKEGGTFDARDIGSRTWDVFDSEGRLLGPVQLPDRFQALRVNGEHIYGVLRDELDVEHIVRLRVVGLTVRPLQREGQ